VSDLDAEDFIIQRNSYSCGPIALMNARMWQGHEIDYAKHYLDFEKLCCCHPVTGTKAFCFDKAAKDFGYAAIKFADIERELKAKQAVLIQFWLDEEEDYHYAMMVWQTDKRYLVINYDGFSHRWVDKNIGIIRAWGVTRQ
jgi:hypothetical protein